VVFDGCRHAIRWFELNWDFHDAAPYEDCQSRQLRPASETQTAARRAASLRPNPSVFPFADAR
jgi:hypothetical protein